MYYTGVTRILPITKAREELPMLVDNAKRLLHEYTITVNGVPAAVLVSASEFQSWKETVDILDNRELMRAIDRGETDLKKGRHVTFERLKKDLKLNV